MYALLAGEFRRGNGPRDCKGKKMKYQTSLIVAFIITVCLLFASMAPAQLPESKSAIPPSAWASRLCG